MGSVCISYAQTDTSQNMTLTDSNLIVNDTISTDSNKIKKSKESNSGFSSKVDYKARDSMKFDVASGKVYMYGGGEVYYETTELKADYIELDLKTNEVFASGVTDSADNKTGTPVFKDN